MRLDRSFLRDIVVATNKIEAIASAVHEDSFMHDEVLQAAVLHHLTVMGEAASRLSATLTSGHPEIPWRQVVAVRNRIVHAYFDLNWEILWAAANEDVPAIRKAIEALPEWESLLSEGA